MRPHDAGPGSPRPRRRRPPPTASAPGARALSALASLLAVLAVLQAEARAAGPPGPGAADAASEDVETVEGAAAGCLFEGARFRPGQAVPVHGEPCLRCRCRRGAPVCRLRVCAPVPDPPPPGCVLLHKANACCAQLHCPEAGAVDNRLEARHGQGQPLRYRSDAPNKGCYLNGSLFAEGSALSSSTLCDYCYCVRGQQRCVRPQCLLPVQGCSPEYRDHACCPTSYQCGGGSNSTTAAPPRRAAGCTVDGKRYREGAQVKSVARGHCETCFCMRGRVRCAPLKCDLPLDGCEPVTAPGKCCPVSYDCSKSRVSITKTVSSTSVQSSKASPGRPTKGENVVRAIFNDARNNREISSKETNRGKAALERSDLYATTLPSLTEEVQTTLMAGTVDNIAITLNTKLDLGDTLDLLKTKNNTILPEKNKILPVIEAIMNKTRQKDQDYDYDYNEPSLPPSLPNLRIIPFVAEDAVIPEDKTRLGTDHNLPDSINSAIHKDPQDKVDNFYFFSPPTETEGGFIPREPSVGGPVYQLPVKYEVKNSDNGHKTTPLKKKPLDVTTIRTVIPEAVTPDPLLGNGGSAPCKSGGRRYRHGELLTGMGSCRMCFCFDGGVVCQEPSCGAVPPGCSRAPTRDPERCCGSIVCGDGDRDSPLLLADLPEGEQGEPPRFHAKIPERPPVLEPVPDLVPAFTATLVPERPTGPAPQPPASASTSTSTTTTSTSTTPEPSTTSSSTAASPSSSTAKTTTARPLRHRPTPTATPSTTTQTKATASPALKTKPTTAKPARKTASTTAKPSPPTSPRPLASPSTTTRTTPPRSSTSPSPPATSSTPSSTTASSADSASVLRTTSTPALSPPPTSPTTSTSSTSTTTTTSPASSSTAAAAAPASTTTTTTTTRRPPVRKERPTTTPASLFAALWGSEDDSANEAQDKVDEDVQYHDLVSTNEHDGDLSGAPGPAAEDDDSFSFDKFLEMFIQPDPPVTSTSTQPTPPAPPTTSRAPTPSTTTTARPTAATLSTPATRGGASSARPTASPTRSPTSPPPAPRTSTTRPTTSPTRKSPPKPTKATSPPRASTTSSPSTTTSRPSTSTSRPSTTTSRPSTTTTTKATTSTTSRPTTSTLRTTTSTTRRPHSSTTTARTTTTTTTSTRPTAATPALLTTATAPTVLAAATRSPSPPRPPAVASGSGPQQHRPSTRRPPSSAAPAPSLGHGLSGLLKLAGCNIYGRMYRVGKIIQELSGPCLECRCTEVGVQCEQLGC